MSFPTANLVDIATVLDRGNLRGFFEETARFYASRLAILDPGGEPVAELNGRIQEELDTGSARLRPVVVYGNIVGRVAAEPESPADETAAAALARHVAELISELAIKEYELNDLSQEILDSYEEVNLFYEISSALGAARDVDGVCSVILKKACEIIPAKRASILLLDEKTAELYIGSAVGIPEEDKTEVRIPIGEGISGKVLESRIPQLVDDVRNLPKGLLKGYETYATRSFISVPLCVDRGAGADPAPIGVLTHRALTASEGGRAIGVINMTDKESKANFTSGDLKLLNALASQAAILIENMRLIEFEKELRIARDIQRGLLPEAPPVLPGLDIAGACVPARNVGGDYFDYMVRENTGELALVIADVSGHNVASALMMAVARSALRSELRRSVDSGTVLYRLNQFLYEDLTRAELFLSAFIVLYEPDEKKLRFANAGHNPALHYRPSEGTTKILDADGLLAGVIEEMSYVEEEIHLEDGDVVLLYTDGLIEAGDPARLMFGIDRLASTLERHAHLPAEELLERVFREVYAFSGEGGQADDMTAVVLKVVEPGGR